MKRRLIFLCFIIVLGVVNCQDTNEFFDDEIVKAVDSDAKKCTSTAGELIFVLDASTSVGPDDFNKEKDFSSKIVDRLGIGSNMTRVALITYNNFPSLVFNLNQYKNSKEINQGIMKAEFTEGITVVGDALDKVLKEIDPKTRPKVGKVIVLISDGKRNGGMDPYLVAKQLKSMNYTIITIGLDKDSDEVAMKAIATTNMYYTIKNFDALDKIVSNIVAISCITFHKAKCPTEEVKKDECIDQKQVVHVTAYYYQNEKCIPENRKLIINCINKNECPKPHYSVAVCTANSNKTHLLNVTYSRIMDQCVQQVKKLKEVECGCPKSIQEKISIVLGKECVNGKKSQVILYNEFRQLTCQQSFFTLAAVNCIDTCVGKKSVPGVCVNGTRTMKVFVKRFVSNKCDLVLESSSVSKCTTTCPKSVKLISNRCVNNTKTVHLITFENIDMQCIQKTKKLDSIKCTAGECSSTKLKRTPCINGRQIVVKVMYTKVGKECKRKTVNMGFVQCIVKKCGNSSFSVTKCDKTMKSTYLVKNYYRSENGTCVFKKKNVKELSCKCYDLTKGTLTVNIGKKCNKGYRSRELIYQEDRQGKCVDVKFTLKRVKCQKRCFRRRYTVTKCKNNQREVIKTIGKVVNGKCESKIEEKKVVKCNEVCPKPQNKTTRCVLGKQALLKVTFREEGNNCKAVVLRLKITKCDKVKVCQNSTYEVAKCDKNAKTTALMKTYYRSVNGTCVKKTREVKELSCKCYQTINGNITVTMGKKCDKGYRSRELVYQEERQGKCENVKFTLRRIKCRKRCFRRRYTVTKCKNNQREVTKTIGKVVNGKCESKIEDKKVVKCDEVCPRPQNKTTRCVLGKQALLKITFKEDGAHCKATVVRLKITNCEKTKKCGNSSFSVTKCDKTMKSTYLVKNYYRSENGACVKKTKNVKELSCKCYDLTKGTLTFNIGKKCNKGYRSRELIYQEDRQGKCVDVKFTLRRVKCQKRCFRRRYTVTKCKNNQREVIKTIGKVVNGKCESKIEEKKVVKCNEVCPKPQNKTTRCVLGKQALLKVTFREEGNNCKAVVLRLKITKCDKVKVCQNSTYEVAKCDKNSKTTALMKTYYRSVNGTCVKKTMKVKELSCKCYQTINGNITVTMGKKCDKGYRSRELVYQEERQGKCENVKFTLRRIKCRKRCFRRRYTVTKCKNNQREVIKTIGKVVNGKCESKIEDKKVVKCDEVCPRPQNKTTRCVLGKQALLKITFKEDGAHCKATVDRLKITNCEKIIVCRNSTYEVAKCEKNAKTTPLIKTYYRNSNGICVRKTRKVKDLPCKCYETTRGNITITVGKTCDKGYRSRELVLREERQGHCVDVKFTLRRIVCVERCLKREFKVTKCKNNKREVAMYRQSLVNGMCEWKLSTKKVVDCKTPCPDNQRKTTRCILGKQVLFEIRFKEEADNCKTTVVRLNVTSCSKEKKCQNTTYEVAKCDKTSKSTSVIRTYYRNVNGTCKKKTMKIKEVPCKCYENRTRDVTVTVGKICEKGYHTRELVLHEERQGQCVDVKFKLSRIKCIVRCLKREYRITKCKDKKREVARYQESLVDGKCEWKVLDRKTVDCQKPCPDPRKKTTRCVLGKQALLEITFKEEAERCKTTVVRIKMMTCGASKACTNSTYEVPKCEKNSQSTSLIERYYTNLNGVCQMKTRKLKALSCKCYEQTRTNLTVSIGKICDSGFKAVELELIEERKGKCEHVKFTLRRIRCEGKCGGIRTVPGPCINETRRVKSYENLLLNGSCTWKFVKESSVDCVNPCPQPKTSETPCLFGKKALIRTTYQLVGKTCIPKVEKLSLTNCKNCTERSLYKLENCTKASITSNLVRISFKNCKQDTTVLKKVDCSCYQLNRNTLKISAASDCINGIKSRILYYFDKGKAACERLELKLSNIKCQCSGNNMTMSICKNGNRTVTFFKKQLTNGKCDKKKLYSKSMNCKSICPDKMVQKSKCVNNRTFETSNEYQQIGDLCKVVNHHIKWSNCTITTISIKECSKKVDLVMTDCIKGNASIIARRQVKKDGKCTDESRRIAEIECSEKCERTLKPKLVAGKCEKNVKLMFYVSTQMQANKCYNKVTYLGSIKCKDC